MTRNPRTTIAPGWLIALLVALALAAAAILATATASPARAATLDIITSVTKTTTTSDYGLHKTVVLGMTWDAGSTVVHAGDTMSITLDPSLGCDATPDMTDALGAVVATGSCTEGVVTWTFTPYVTTHPLDLQGGARFSVETIAADDRVTVTYGGAETVLPFTIHGTGTDTTSYAKWADSDGTWRIRVGPPLTAGTLTFREEVGECQTITAVDFPKPYAPGTWDPATQTGTIVYDGHRPALIVVHVDAMCVPEDFIYRNAVTINGKTRSARAEYGSGAWGSGATTTTPPTSSTSTTTEPTSSTTTTTAPPTTTSTTSSGTSSTSTAATTGAGTGSSTLPPKTSARPTGVVPLPVTGADLRLGFLGLGLVALGVAAVAASRRTGRYAR